jgi:hypothetical protein
VVREPTSRITVSITHIWRSANGFPGRPPARHGVWLPGIHNPHDVIHLKDQYLGGATFTLHQIRRQFEMEYRVKVTNYGVVGGLLYATDQTPSEGGRQIFAAART